MVFCAGFDGVKDGPGNGVSFPTEVGELIAFTETGDPLPVVSPNSGVYSEKLVLTDVGGDPTLDFGVEALPVAFISNGLNMSFQVRFEEGTDFSVNVTDTTGIDISRVKFDNGNVNVNGKKGLGGQAQPNLDYQVDIHLAPRAGGKDLFVVLVTDLSTGRLIGSWTGLIPGGYRPIASASLIKCGSSPGTVTLDAIKMRAMD